MLTFRPHWASVFVPTCGQACGAVAVALMAAVVGALVGALMRALMGAIGNDVLIFMLVAAMVLVPAGFVVRVLQWRSTIYQLTTRRLRLRSGVLSRSGRDFPLVRISNMSFSAGPAGRLLGYGRLVAETPGERGRLVLDGIPDAERVQATLFQLVEDEHARLAREDDLA